MTTEARALIATDGAAGNDPVHFLNCTGINVTSIIDALERELGRPVVTSTQAMLWHCLRLLGRVEAVDGLGALFRTKPPSAAP